MAACSTIQPAYEHYWSPQFHESFVGGYMDIRYNTQANSILCTAEGNGAGVINAIGSGTLAVAQNGCNNNWNMWWASTRLQYDFTKSLYIGVEFLYQYLHTATLAGDLATPTVLTPNNGCGAPGTSCTLKNMNLLAVTLRMHKDFLP